MKFKLCKRGFSLAEMLIAITLLAIFSLVSISLFGTLNKQTKYVESTLERQELRFELKGNLTSEAACRAFLGGLAVDFATLNEFTDIDLTRLINGKTASDFNMHNIQVDKFSLELVSSAGGVYYQGNLLAEISSKNSSDTPLRPGKISIAIEKNAVTDEIESCVAGEVSQLASFGGAASDSGVRLLGSELDWPTQLYCINNNNPDQQTVFVLFQTGGTALAPTFIYNHNAGPFGVGMTFNSDGSFNSASCLSAAMCGNCPGQSIQQLMAAGQTSN